VASQPFTVSVQSRKETIVSPWITLVQRSVISNLHPVPQEFYSIRPPDYVVVLALTADGRIPLVRQFRAAVERPSLELPGGLLDRDETPARCALRELQEETGYTAPAAHAVGCLDPDPGRMENRIWAFCVPDCVPPLAGAWQAEPEVEVVLYSKAQLRAAMLSGEFCSAMHIAVVSQSVVHGHFSF
jgi:8-oxo-dGTP pyrophosphatase MutT (NUDIX family)